MSVTEPIRLQLYLSPEQICAYLPGKQSRMLFPDPELTINPVMYNALTDMGFRRSGASVYRHECDQCRACTPIRLPVTRFRPRRIQRRTWDKNRQLEVAVKPAGFDEEQFDLYCRYIGQRHSGSSMASISREQFMNFLACDWCDTRFFEFRHESELVAVAVTDLLPTGLSAVYTFFDPRRATMSLGSYAILWQIHMARQYGLPWLYLGFWIPGCQKMEYKARYRPLQAFHQGKWIEYGAAESLPNEKPAD
ncbi:MAG: arginyltransferase [Gammaproteobacteria bacterium]|nr:arginyltransferase [Gammaproteobacteria bacterium]